MEHTGRNLVERIPERLDGYRKIIPDGEKECVWAEAGVVPYKLCDANFDCGNCPFDIVMRGGSELIPKRMDSRGGKLCANRFYHCCHTWARIEEKGHVRIGIDDFGCKILGPVEKICLPLRDEKITKHNIRVKARSIIVSIASPAEGFAVEINEELFRKPELVNTSPYEKGWLVLVRPTRLVHNLQDLFYGTAALQWFDAEPGRLVALITPEINSSLQDPLGMTMQDGGQPDYDILSKLHQNSLKKIFKAVFSHGLCK